MQNTFVAVLCGAFGLSFTFGGIWLGDARFNALLDLPYGTFAMRCFTLFFYMLFLALALYLNKHRKAIKQRRPLLICLAVGLGLFFVATLLALVIAPLFPPESTQHMIACWAALFLSKAIGAPLTVSLIAVFALVGREYLLRMSSWGILGAFILNSLFSMLLSESFPDTILALLVSAILLSLASAAATLGLYVKPQNMPFSSKGQDTPGVIKRPWRQVVSPGLIITLLFSAMMLGFLRNGVQAGDPHTSPAALVALLVLAAIASLWPGLRSDYLFFGGILLAGAGLLLNSLLTAISPEIPVLLYGSGMALFEVLTWSLVVWMARNTYQTLMAAVVGRAISAIGHFLGTTIMLAALAFTEGSTSDAFSIGASFVIFLYLVMIVLFLRSSTLQPPFMSVGDFVEDSSAAYERTEKEKAGEDDELPEGEEEQDLDYLYWSKPCDVIAETYTLTAREREVLELLARGRNLSAMEDKLVISSNTLKMHIRHIYTKLDIHSKQDVINMVEEVRQ